MVGQPKAGSSLLAAPGRRALLASAFLLFCAYAYSLAGLSQGGEATVADIRVTVRRRQPEQQQRHADERLLREAAAAVQALWEAGELAKAEKAAAAAGGKEAAGEAAAEGQSGAAKEAAGKTGEASGTMAADAQEPAKAAEPAKASVAAASAAAADGAGAETDGAGSSAGSSAGSASSAPAEAEAAGVAAAVAAGAGLHGFVNKQGPLDPRKWRAAHKDLREARLASWGRLRQQQLAKGKAPPALAVMAGCQVWVNHKLKVLFVRHAKTGSSSLFCHFSGCREGGGADTAFKPRESMPDDKVERLWRDYLVVSFVRNPYQRAVSSYKMMMRNLAPSSIKGSSYGWDDFCFDPASFVGKCLADERCHSKGAAFVLAHIQPQYTCMLTREGGLAVDFIGRTEHIEEDLRALMAEVQRRRKFSAPAGSLDNVNGRGCNETMQGIHSAAPEQYCDPAEYFEGRHAACFQHIQRAYRKDMEVLLGGKLAAGTAGAAGRTL